MTDKHTLVERDEILVQRIAAVLDHPSLYMGGPSRQSLMTARRLLPIIEAEAATRITALEASLAYAQAAALHAQEYAFAAQEKWGEALEWNTALEAREAELVEGMRYILPYLEWTIGRESPGHHPTMPSAVAEFRATLAKHQEGEGNA